MNKVITEVEVRCAKCRSRMFFLSRRQEKEDVVYKSNRRAGVNEPLKAVPKEKVPVRLSTRPRVGNERRRRIGEERIFIDREPPLEFHCSRRCGMVRRVGESKVAAAFRRAEVKGTRTLYLGVDF